MSKKRKELNAIFRKYKLDRDVHIFQSDEFTKITRQGIQKIQNQEWIQVKLELVHCSSREAVVKATGYFEAIEYQTFGEASPQNNTFTFPVAMAQKRAQERLILDMVLKEFDEVVMGESEINSQPSVLVHSQLLSGTTSSSQGDEANAEVLKKIKAIRK
jgi:hypothetical protein